MMAAEQSAMNGEVQDKRILYLDCLRVYATFAVMLLHTCASRWYASDINEFEWNVLNFFDSMVRWAVPVFVMISGNLFLSQEIDVKRIFKKNILHMAIAYVGWAFFYAAFWPILFAVIGRKHNSSIGTIISDWISGAYHMWFIPMIIGLYLLLPILKAIVNAKKGMYFCILAVIFTVCVPTLSNIINDFVSNKGILGKTIYELWTEINAGVITNMNMKLVLGFTGYYICGYLINQNDIESVWRKIVYMGGIGGFIFTVVATVAATRQENLPCDNYYGYFSLNVFMEAVAVFVFAKYNIKENDRINIWVQKLSKYSFGAYLAHVFVINIIGIWGLCTNTFNPIISIAVISLGCFIVSFGISFIINKIPVINKYLV